MTHDGNVKTKRLFVFVQRWGRAFWVYLITLKVFLACSALGQAPSPPGEQLLHAIQFNDTNTVFKMLEADTNLARTLYSGYSPLNRAAGNDSVEMVDRLLKCGADVNAPADLWGSVHMRVTPLEVVIWLNRTNVFKQLLAAGADPNVQSQYDGTALHYALSHKRTEMAEVLLDHGADPFLGKSNPNRKQTPLEMAITESDGKLVPRMLSEGPRFFEVSDSAAKPSPGTPAGQRKQTFAEFLASHSATLLSAAAQRGELEAVQGLLKAGASAKDGQGGGMTLLQTFAVAEAVAARADHFDADRWLQIRQALISNGAVYDAFAATAMGDLEQARRLCAVDKNLARARDREGETPLHWAVQNDQLALTKFWLEAGAPPAATNLPGQTALHIAAAKDLVQQTKVLLAAHAATDARDTNGWTPLDAAIHARQAETIRVFLSDTSAPARSDRAIALPIHQAAAVGNLDALVPLAEATNNLEAREELGLTPLQLAVEHGHLAAAALLVDSGANVNARDPDGNTLLHWVILHNYPGTLNDVPPANWLARMSQDPRKQKCLECFANGQPQAGGSVVLNAGFLLACGIDDTATNHDGQTPIQVAKDGRTNPLYARDTLLKLLTVAGGGMNGRDAEENPPPGGKGSSPGK